MTADEIPQTNDQLISKIVFSSHHMEQKTLIEAINVNNIHTGKSFFAAPTFKGF